MGKFLAVALVAATGVAASAMLVGSTEPARAQSTCSDNQNRWLHVVNLTRHSILYMKSRPGNSSLEWGDDLLGSTATPSGSLVYVLLPSTDCQCRADLQITLEGGENRVLTYQNVNYCSASDGLRARLVID